MKRIDIFCASQASTAICLSMQDQPSSSTSSCSSSAAIQLGGRAIDRHNPIITRDSRRFTTVPCSSQTPPINPVPYHQLQKNKKSSNNSDHHQQTKKNDLKKKKKKNPNDIATTTTTNKKIITTSSDSIYKNTFTSSVPADIKRKSSVKPGGDLITPPGSTRYLLSDGAYFDGFSDYNDPVFALVPGQSNKNITNPADLVLDQQHQSTTASKSSLSLSSSLSEKPSSNQVVVLRVSLHCKGCAGKLKKHLSRMEGVTSFNIDFAAKKVTIVGDVTPLSVLASVSKVKNAQFWPVPEAAPSSPTATTAVVFPGFAKWVWEISGFD
ncbi:hypothetical protein LWI28_005118 [Acer negundo]|uniref:HMA domain-containing protein n=1 Tax=Acer negundo TaxID=4023 RepID=A0AAD5I5L2_ACENE|nr:hypothetical protein LWI28_005118 [Acer negundo]KAK4834187.1 hypothetical protein QYF36_018543 [Acer negundo]